MNKSVHTKKSLETFRMPLVQLLIIKNSWKKKFCSAILFQILLPNTLCNYMDANKTAGEEARRQLHQNAASNLEQVLAATPHKTPTVQPPASYHENYSS